MDLKLYYQKIRKIESDIEQEHVLVVSCETADGGKPGLMTEVSRHQAAKLLAEGRATLATPEQIDAFRARNAEALKQREAHEAAQKLQVRLISEDDLRALKNSQRPVKS